MKSTKSWKKLKLPAWIIQRSNAVFVREKPAHAVYTLPEVWRHARRMALYMLGQAPRPEPVDEQALVRKYGYTIHDVFCVDCWLDLILDGRKTDS